MLLRAVALDGTDLDVLREWRTLPELKHILVQRLAIVDSVGLDAFFGTYSYCIAVESPSLVSFFLFFLSVVLQCIGRLFRRRHSSSHGLQ